MNWNIFLTSVFILHLMGIYIPVVAQVDPSLPVLIDSPPALEGGKGFIQTQSADLYGTGYLGIGFNGIYNSTKLPGLSGREQLFAGSTSLTYDLSEEMQLSGVLYAIGRGLIYSGDANPDKFFEGFGAAKLAAKYRLPFTGDRFDLGTRLAFHVPMGANFTIHPSYPYDTNQYSLELSALQSLQFNPWLRLHLNEGFRWQGLRDNPPPKDDLVLLSAAFDYNLSQRWFAFSEIASAIEMDEKVQPMRDRLVFSQGFQYVTPWNISLNLVTNLRLSQDRRDGTPNRAEDWRIMFGISFSKRTFQPDRDHDGIPDIYDLGANTPKGWPVDSRGRVLDSDGDGIPDGKDKEAFTPKGALVDRFGRAIDSDLDGIPDGIDVEPYSPQNALVDKQGRAIDSDGDGVFDGIDQEPNSPKGTLVSVNGIAFDSDSDGVPDGIDLEPGTPKGTLVDAKGQALPPMEIELLTKGLLRVHKIYFDSGKSIIKPESYSILSEIGRLLGKYPQIKIQISGHTDGLGNDDVNYKLSQKRAQAVREYLIAYFSDISADNLTAEGYGSRRPIADNDTEIGRTMNRRVEFLVLNPEQLTLK